MLYRISLSCVHKICTEWSLLFTEKLIASSVLKYTTAYEYRTLQETLHRFGWFFKRLPYKKTSVHIKLSYEFIALHVKTIIYSILKPRHVASHFQSVFWNFQWGHLHFKWGSTLELQTPMQNVLYSKEIQHAVTKKPFSLLHTRGHGRRCINWYLLGKTVKWHASNPASCFILPRQNALQDFKYSIYL